MEIADFLRLTLVQYDISWEKIDENLSRIEGMIQAYNHQTDVIILPESFSTGFSTQAAHLAESSGEKILYWMKKMARDSCSAICGSVFVGDGSRYFNRFYWVEPEGKVLFYDKRHIFSLGGEDRIFSPGSQQLIIDYKGWRIFPTVCYDLRFPVWCRNVHDYDLMINVANWPAARNEVWKTLLKARAIENQCYVAGVNRVGVDGEKVDYHGNSLVVDPKGIKIFKAHHQENIETVTLDYHFLHHLREKFNTLRDRDHFEIL